MNKKKAVILGISIGLLDVILLFLTAGICLFLIFMAVIRLTSPKPVEPEDDLARLICESLGEGFVYDGMYIQRDSVRVYDIDVYTGDSESVHLLIDKINEYISGEEEKIIISFVENNGGFRTGLFHLRNYSLTSPGDMTYDGLYSMGISAEALSMWPDIEMYTGIKGIRELILYTPVITDQANEQGIYWKDVWQDLEDVVYIDYGNYGELISDYGKRLTVSMDDELDNERIMMIFGERVRKPGVDAVIYLESDPEFKRIWEKDLKFRVHDGLQIYIYEKDMTDYILFYSSWERDQIANYNYTLFRIDKDGNEITEDEMRVYGRTDDPEITSQISEFENRLEYYLERSTLFAEIKNGQVIYRQF